MIGISLTFKALSSKLEEDEDEDEEEDGLTRNDNIPP
jgi:hypothetical protein